MPYATQQDLIDRFGADELIQLTDDDNAGVINTDRVTQVLGDASTRIDGYLASRYTLPLTTVPPALTQYACDIARYILAKDTPTDTMSARYDEAIKFLGRVASGVYSLGIDAQGSTPALGGGVHVDSVGRTFTQHGLRDYTQPWDWGGRRRGADWP